MKDFFAAYLRNPIAKIGTIILLIIFIITIFASTIANHDPLTQDMNNVLLKPGSYVNGESFILGTDGFGRDILSRILF